METDLLKEWFQWKQEPDFCLFQKNTQIFVWAKKMKKTQIQNLQLNPKSSYLCNEIKINQFSGQCKSSWIELDQWKLEGSFMEGS